MKPFGQRGCVTRARLNRLPLPMQAEGIRLMFEMGISKSAVCQTTGRTDCQISEVLNASSRHALIYTDKGVA